MNLRLDTYNVCNNVYVNFDDNTNSDPAYIIGLLENMIYQNSGKRPNAIVMCSTIESVIVNHPKTKERFNCIKELISISKNSLPDILLGLKVVISNGINYIIPENTILVGYMEENMNFSDFISSPYTLTVCNILSSKYPQWSISEDGKSLNYNQDFSEDLKSYIQLEQLLMDRRMKYGDLKYDPLEYLNLTQQQHDYLLNDVFTTKASAGAKLRGAKISLMNFHSGHSLKVNVAEEEKEVIIKKKKKGKLLNYYCVCIDYKIEHAEVIVIKPNIKEEELKSCSCGRRDENGRMKDSLIDLKEYPVKECLFCKCSSYWENSETCYHPRWVNSTVKVLIEKGQRVKVYVYAERKSGAYFEAFRILNDMSGKYDIDEGFEYND
jgi:hypothetical protein